MNYRNYKGFVEGFLLGSLVYLTVPYIVNKIIIKVETQIEKYKQKYMVPFRESINNDIHNAINKAFEEYSKKQNNQQTELMKYIEETGNVGSTTSLGYTVFSKGYLSRSPYYSAPQILSTANLTDSQLDKYKVSWTSTELISKPSGVPNHDIRKEIPNPIIKTEYPWNLSSDIEVKEELVSEDTDTNTDAEDLLPKPVIPEQDACVVEPPTTRC